MKSSLIDSFPGRDFEKISQNTDEMCRFTRIEMASLSVSFFLAQNFASFENVNQCGISTARNWRLSASWGTN